MIHRPMDHHNRTTLPCEGKVALKNKAAERLSVRMFPWVDKKGVSCRVNKKRSRRSAHLSEGILQTNSSPL